MPMGLNSGHKTALTTLMTDLTAAIDGLSPSDSSQIGVRAVLVKCRTELTELLKNERTQ
jgi:hypothetical protein